MQGTLPDFVGFDNYVEIFTQSDFPAVLMRSLGLMVVLTVLSIIGLGMLVAVLMTQLGRGMAHARLGRPAAGVGDAAPVGDGRLGLDLRHPVRRGQLGLLNTITGTSDWTNHSWLIDPGRSSSC